MDVLSQPHMPLKLKTCNVLTIQRLGLLKSKPKEVEQFGSDTPRSSLGLDNFGTILVFGITMV